MPEGALSCVVSTFDGVPFDLEAALSFSMSVFILATVEYPLPFVLL